MESSGYILSDADFKRLGSFIYSNYGIKMPLAKKSMLQARLQKRLRVNNISSFREYCDLVLSGKNKEDEIIQMIDVVSTNKTDFFREPMHFDFLRSDFLPEFYRTMPAENLKIWSAACSSGEEIYSIAMTISEFMEGRKKFGFSILGTDISTRILEQAMLAVYAAERVATVPVYLKRKYMLRSKSAEKNNVRIIPELRSKTSFQRLNLMDVVYRVPGKFDIIFCRNVLIYFDRETQEKVITKLCAQLKTGGYLFLGHSESITGIHVPLKTVKPTIFIKTDQKSSSS